MENIKVIRLLNNGEKFNSSNYNEDDNLDGLILCGESLVRIRITAYETSIDFLSDIDKADEEFVYWVDDFLENYDATKYLINGYQEYKYPFWKDDEINFIELVKWVYKHMKEDERLTLILSSFYQKAKIVIVARNNIGVSVDWYDSIDNEPLNARLFYFDDYNI